jgi:hypothetical protein
MLAMPLFNGVEGKMSCDGKMEEVCWKVKRGYTCRKLSAAESRRAINCCRVNLTKLKHQALEVLTNSWWF